MYSGLSSSALVPEFGVKSPVSGSISSFFLTGLGGDSLVFGSSSLTLVPGLGGGVSLVFGSSYSALVLGLGVD